MRRHDEKHVVKYLDELGDLAEETTKYYMQMVWPALCEQAGIPLFPMPPPDQVHAVWPFLAAAVRLSKCAIPAEECKTEHCLHRNGKPNPEQSKQSTLPVLVAMPYLCLVCWLVLDTSENGGTRKSVITSYVG